MGGNSNGAQPLSPNSAESSRFSSWFMPKPFVIMDRRGSLDSAGYYFGIPFASKFSDSTIFDLKIQGDFLNLPGTAILKGSADLSQISLRMNDDQEIIMKPTQANSPNSLVFKSEDGAFRAIYLYSNDDLTNLARIYIESESVLIELWAN
jgi:hypothetical protein